jgi:hypothetical protein
MKQTPQTPLHPQALIRPEKLKGEAVMYKTVVTTISNENTKFQIIYHPADKTYHVLQDGKILDNDIINNVQYLERDYGISLAKNNDRIYITYDKSTWKSVTQPIDEFIEDNSAFAQYDNSKDLI